MTEVELPIPEGEEALDDHPDYMEVADGEEWEELGFGATPDPQPIDISMIPPDEGDDQQGDWDVGASHSAASLAEAALEVGPGPGPLMTPGRMTEKERINARRIAVRAATLALHHAPNVHYTQDSRRWQGIAVMVISHGSEGGPYFLPYNYRSDIQSIRRYIHWLA
jgi:hypothetical protein